MLNVAMIVTGFSSHSQYDLIWYTYVATNNSRAPREQGTEKEKEPNQYWTAFHTRSDDETKKRCEFRFN